MSYDISSSESDGTARSFGGWSWTGRAFLSTSTACSRTSPLPWPLCETWRRSTFVSAVTWLDLDEGPFAPARGFGEDTLPGGHAHDELEQPMASQTTAGRASGTRQAKAGGRVQCARYW